jgi:hypothetical protein
MFELGRISGSSLHHQNDYPIASHAIAQSDDQRGESLSHTAPPQT